MEVLIDGTWFMNGNAVEANGTLVHWEHGRRRISRGGDYESQPQPIVTHFGGRRINWPNDVAVAPDGTIWFTDPTFGIVMPNQGALAEPELNHRSVYRFDPASGELGRMADFEEPNGLAFTVFPPLRSRRIAPSAARTDDGCSSPQQNICWRSISSDELEEMSVGIAN